MTIATRNCACQCRPTATETWCRVMPQRSRLISKTAACRTLHSNPLATKELKHTNVSYHEAPEQFRRRMETLIAANAAKPPGRRHQ